LRNATVPPSSATTERCFNVAANLIEDAGAEARTYGKRILWAIYGRSRSDFKDLLQRVRRRCSR
jgi:hypothetical protein